MRPGFSQASFESNAEAATWWTWERRLHEWSCKYTKNQNMYQYVFFNMYMYIYICIFVYIYIYFYMYTYIWANYRDLSPGEVHFGSRYDSLVHFQVSQKPGRRFETIWLIGDTRQRLQTTTLCCWLTMRRTALSQIQQMRRALGSARVKALCGHTRTGKEVHKAGIKSSLRSRGWSMSSQCTKQFQRLYLYI